MCYASFWAAWAWLSSVPGPWTNARSTRLLENAMCMASWKCRLCLVRYQRRGSTGTRSRRMAHGIRGSSTRSAARRLRTTHDSAQFLKGGSRWRGADHLRTRYTLSGSGTESLVRSSTRTRGYSLRLYEREALVWKCWSWCDERRLG